MIDTATGMRPGERYAVESRERTRHFPGFFLDGKYYLGPELLTAVGWLEGQQFLYDELDPTGEPVFPGRVAGTIEDLTLTLADGGRLKLSELPYRAQTERLMEEHRHQTARGMSEQAHMQPGKGLPLLLCVSVGLLVGGCLLAWIRAGRHPRIR
ncbi:hypothetical protein D3C76_73280 [compost metagenome]